MRFIMTCTLAAIFSCTTSEGQNGALGSNGSAGSNGSNGASGAAGSRGPTGPTGAPGSAGAAGADAPPASNDGTRIKQRYVTTADGLSAPNGFYDSQLQAECAIARASDGKQRCMYSFSNAAQPLFFADPGCTQRIAHTGLGCVFPFTVAFVGAYEPPTCTAYAVNYTSRFFTIGTKRPAASAIYNGTPANCVRYAAVEAIYDTYAVGAEIPPATFAEVTIAP